MPEKTYQANIQHDSGRIDYVGALPAKQLLELIQEMLDEEKLLRENPSYEFAWENADPFTFTFWEHALPENGR